MNKETVSKIEKISGLDEVVFSVGHNTFFIHDDDKTVVRYCADAGTVELSLGTIEEMCEGSSSFESTDINLNHAVSIAIQDQIKLTLSTNT